MTIRKSELKTKWYYRGSKVFFWVFQAVVLFAMISESKTSILDIIIGFAIWSLILIGIWKVFLYVAFGGVEKELVKKEAEQSKTDITS